MILKDKKLFFLGIFLIFGLIVSLSAVSAENIQDVSDTDLVSLGDEKIVLTDSGDESGGGDSGDNPGDNPAGDNPGDNPAGDNPGDKLKKATHLSLPIWDENEFLTQLNDAH